MTPTTRRLVLGLSTLAGASVATACSAVLGLGDPVLDDALGKDQVVDVAHFDSAFVDAPADTTSDSIAVDAGGDSGPETIASGDSNFTPWGIAINDNYVFWTVFHIPATITRADKDGKNPQNLAQGSGAGFAPAYIKADATDAYWSTVDFNGNPSILRCAAAGCGGTPKSLVSPPLNYSPYQIALSATHVYFAEAATFKVRRVSKMGGAAEDVTTLLDKPHGLSINGTTLYVAVENGGVAKVDISGALPATATVISPTASPAPATAVTSTSSRVFYTHYADPGLVLWTSIDGADAGNGVQATQLTNPLDIDNDGFGLYWVVQGTGGTDGEIDTCPLAGNCVVKPLAQGYEAPKQLALDATYVYFSVKGISKAGAIMRVHK